MNILNIALLEIKRDFRDIRTLVFMLAFPIVLMLVLGSALSNTFTTTTPIADMHILYKDTSDGSMSHYFNEFAKGAKESGITFKRATRNTDGINEVKQNRYDGYVEINQNGIQLFLNERNSIGGSILQGMLTAFVDKYNVAAEVAKVNPDQIKTVFTNGTDKSYIKEISLNSDKEPGSMDYYAIVMTTMIGLYAAMSASSLIDGERIRKTADRLMASPVRKREIFVGKVLGNIVINFLCIIVIILFSHLFFKANWGDHIGLVLIVLLTEVLLAVSFGLGMSFLTKSGAGARVIIMIVIQLSSFFGGAYFKIENPEGIMKIITNLSPLTWENTAITNIIYANDFTAAIPVLFLNLGVSILFLLIAIISLRRREGL